MPSPTPLPSSRRSGAVIPDALPSLPAWEIAPGIPYSAAPPPQAIPTPRGDATLQKSTVLVVDDEEFYRNALERILHRVGHRVVTARDAQEALAAASSQPLDLVLCDVRMPGLSGFELVRQLRELDADLPCIVITGYGGAESSFEALRAGAFWYLEKPFDQNLDTVRRLVEQAIEHGRLKAENRMLHSQLRSRYKFDSIIGKSPSLLRTLEMVEKYVESDATVLVRGESGTGKELFARALHYNGRRADRMLVPVNCGAIASELLESELFGHVKGAFTGAVHAREGRFAVANGGTIFLDEIGDMSMDLQVKLLRVLQERCFEPVGSSKTVEVDVRVIAATHRNLEEMIEQGTFREDLYFRLNVLELEVPSLRQRRDDIPLLVHHFLDAAAQNGGAPVDTISEEAMHCMVDYDWPGNVRELQNLVERLVVLCRDSEIGLDDLPSRLRNAVASESRSPVALAVPKVPPEGIAMRELLDEIETAMILDALEQTSWNKNRAAGMLGISRPALIERVKKKGLAPAEG